MKSKKARRFINDRLSIGSLTFIAADVEYCVTRAEQEAEERIREKAIEAFKSSCKYQDGCLGADRKCDQTQCADLNEFIQKLNEE